MIRLETERLVIRSFRASDWEALHEIIAAKIVTGTAAANRASRRLLERLGFEKTGESVGSFRKAPDGEPIEFLGYSYALSRGKGQVA